MVGCDEGHPDALGDHRPLAYTTVPATAESRIAKPTGNVAKKKEKWQRCHLACRHNNRQRRLTPIRRPSGQAGESLGCQKHTG